MSILDDMKAKHLACESDRWDKAVRNVSRFLNYSRRVCPHFQVTAETDAEDAMVREVTLRLFTVCDQTRFQAFGGLEDGFGIKMGGYGFVSSQPVEMLEFVRFFVGHELLDDGIPGVGYYRHNSFASPDPYTRCGKNDHGARPYFHRNIDGLREEYPDSEYLTLERALEVLNFYEDEHARKATELQEIRKRNLSRKNRDPDLDEYCSQDKIDYYKNLSPDDQALSDLAHGIIETKPDPRPW
jgi:hypothetical protein